MTQKCDEEEEEEEEGFKCEQVPKRPVAGTVYQQGPLPTGLMGALSHTTGLLHCSHFKLKQQRYTGTANHNNSQIYRNRPFINDTCVLM